MITKILDYFRTLISGETPYIGTPATNFVQCYKSNPARFEVTLYNDRVVVRDNQDMIAYFYMYDGILKGSASRNNGGEYRIVLASNIITPAEFKYICDNIEVYKMKLG